MQWDFWMDKTTGSDFLLCLCLLLWTEGSEWIEKSLQVHSMPHNAGNSSVTKHPCLHAVYEAANTNRTDCTRTVVCLSYKIRSLRREEFCKNIPQTFTVYLCLYAAFCWSWCAYWNLKPQGYGFCHSSLSAMKIWSCNMEICTIPPFCKPSSFVHSITIQFIHLCELTSPKKRAQSSQGLFEKWCQFLSCLVKVAEHLICT